MNRNKRKNNMVMGMGKIFEKKIKEKYDIENELNVENTADCCLFPEHCQC